MSKKKYRKSRPQPPKYHWFGADGCWFCKNRNACGGCKTLKGYPSRRQVRNDAKCKEENDYK